MTQEAERPETELDDDGWPKVTSRFPDWDQYMRPHVKKILVSLEQLDQLDPDHHGEEEMRRIVEALGDWLAGPGVVWEPSEYRAMVSHAWRGWSGSPLD